MYCSINIYLMFIFCTKSYYYENYTGKSLKDIREKKSR